MFTRSRFQDGSFRQRQRKGNAVWELRFYDQGKRKAVIIGTLREFPTLSAAKKAPVAQSILMAANNDQPTAVKLITVGTLLSRFEVEEMPSRYSTSASYKSIIKNYLRPRWEEVALTDVRTMDIERWLNGLSLAPRTKTHIKQLVHTIFNAAVRWELMERNPAVLVRVKGGSKRLVRPQIITPEQFQLLISKLQEPYRTMAIVAASLGLRISEVVGLRWSDFDFEHNTVIVQRSVVHGRVADTKTEYSRDRLPLDSLLVEILLAHRKICQQSEEGWVFASPVTGKPYHQETIQQKHLKPTGESLGLTELVGIRSDTPIARC